MSSADRLELLLLTIATEHNTSVLAQATNELSSKWLKQSDSIINLLQIVSLSVSIPVRQLAAVELRKLIEKNDGKSWLQLSESVQHEIKAGILSTTINQENTLVRHALARVISEIAKIEITNHRWFELIDALNNLCSSPVVSQREVGVYVLYSLFEVIADELSDYTPQLLALFCTTVDDSESLTVAVTTVQALGKMAEFVEDAQSASFMSFRDLIPKIAQVMQRALAQGDDISALKIFEFFEGLLLLEMPFLSKHFGELVSLYVGISSTATYADETRVMAMSFIMLATTYAKSKLTKLGLVPSIIGAILPIAAEDEPEDREDQYPGKTAIQVINSMALAFPPHHVFPAVMQNATLFFQNTQQPGFRRAAMLAIAVLVEGCADHMRERISEILSLVIHALQDGSPAVRRAACTALGALAEDLSEEIAEQHTVLVPLLLALVDDPDPEVQPVVLGAIISLVEALDDLVLSYVEPITTKLVQLLSSIDRKSVLASVNCIGSVARASGPGFAPYFEVIMTRLHSLMSLTDVSDLDLRAVATDAVAAVAEAVGKEAFSPYMSTMMELAINGINIDNSQLRECSYLFFGTLARLFGEDFSPYLPLVVPQILHTCNQQDKEWNDLHGSVNPHNTDSSDVGKEIDISSDSDEEDDGPGKYSFNSAVSLEKASSFEALGLLFSATRGAFMPFVSDSANAALSSLENFNDDVRISASQCLLRFFVTMQSMANTSAWQAGLSAASPVHENVASIGKIAMEGIFKMLDEEEARMVVAQTFQELTETLKLIGPVSLGFEYSGSSEASMQHVNTLANLLLQIFRGEHVCQISEDFDDAPDRNDDELAELDALVISTAADVLGALAAVLGPDYAPYFSPFLPLIAKHYQKSRPVSDRSMAIGSLAEVAEGLEHGITEFSLDILSLFIRALRDEDDEVRSNAAFGVGLLVFHSTLDLSSYYPQLLQLLHPFFTIESKSNIVDNACGAVARMILRSPNAVPLEQVLPVFLGALPLKKDFEENNSVFKCIFSLLESQTPMIISELPRLQKIFQHVLASSPSQVDDLTRDCIVRIMPTLGAYHSISIVKGGGHYRVSIIVKTIENNFRITVPGFDVIQHVDTGPGRRGIALSMESTWRQWSLEHTISALFAAVVLVSSDQTAIQEQILADTTSQTKDSQATTLVCIDGDSANMWRLCIAPKQLLSTSIAHLVVECEQVTGHRIQSGLVPAIQKSRLRLLGRALDPGVENVYTWLRGGVLNGEADLDQRWLDGTVEHESMGTRHDNRALAARLADFLQVAYWQYQSTLWKYHLGSPCGSCAN
ncbi:hypothetical protein BASA61_007707 [Batrachochytrium salamandrivorans]|nr:hypothetical protein BASA61_007707 [Batrachochytrium salamandrivorans]